MLLPFYFFCFTPETVNDPQTNHKIRCLCDRKPQSPFRWRITPSRWVFKGTNSTIMAQRIGIVFQYLYVDSTEVLRLLE